MTHDDHPPRHAVWWLLLMWVFYSAMLASLVFTRWPLVAAFWVLGTYSAARS